MRLKKTIIAVCLALVLITALFSGMQMTASAATEINLTSLTSSQTTANYKVTKYTETIDKKSRTYYTLELTGEGVTYELTGTLNGHVIVSANSTVVLKNAVIKAGDSAGVVGYTQKSPYQDKNVGTAALSVQGNTTCQLLLSGDNTLTGFSSTSVLLNSAGISVENTINMSTGERHLASLIIDNAEGANGSLSVSGGNQSAAIGGNVNRATGNITIEGGNITATAGSWATAIGDGDSDKTTSGDIVTWSCALPGDSAAAKADTDGDGKPDTCQPAKITINDGNLKLYGKNAAPAIGTSDELSGQNGTGDGSGVKNRVWQGQAIEINGGTTICVGGGTSLTSIGAGLYTILSPGNITINQNEQSTTRLIAISLDAGYTINNSGMTADQNNPDISPESTANVFCFKYTNGLLPKQIKLQNLIPEDKVSQAAVDFVNGTFGSLDLTGLITGGKLKGLALVLPDGHYKVDVDDATIADVELEGGGIVYGDASKPIFSISLDVNKDNKEWDHHDKSFALKKTGSSNYLTTFAVENGTYSVYEIVKAENGSAKYVDTGNKVTVAGNATKVTVDYYTVTFQEADGQKTYDEQVILKNQKAAAIADPVKTGYTFKGWDLTVADTVITKPTTVNAQWEANTYQVSYEANYPAGKNGTGSVTPNPQTFTYDEQQELAANGFVLSGYTFKGWSKSAAGVYDGQAATWTYKDREQVKNLASSGNVTLYAVWEKNLDPVEGSVTIEYSYEENGAVKVINPSDRVQNTCVTLWRIDQDGEQIKVKDITVEFEYTAPSPDEEGILISKKEISFDDLAATDEQGRAYTYFVSTERENYDVSYTDPDENTKLNMRMKYNPNCFDVNFEVALGNGFSGLADSIRPEEIYVKVVYRDHDQAGWTSAPTAGEGTVISQHGGSKDAMDGVYVAGTWDEQSSTYTGKYPVWLYSVGDDNEIVYYDYHILIVGYKLSDGTVTAVTNAGYTESYKDTTSAAISGGTTEWVYYDTADKQASGIMRAELGLETYNIRYALNDDSNDPAQNSDNAPVKYTYGIGVPTDQMPEAARSNYTFDGWYCDDQATDSISTVQTGDVTLSARWIPKTYSITYDTGDKGKDLDPGSYVYGQGDTALPTPDADEDDGAGYKFDGWYEDSSFTGDKIESLGSDESGDITLHAKWVPINYTIVFHANNAAATLKSDETDMEPMNMVYDVAADLTANAYEAVGYVFKGWATAPDAVSKEYTDGQNVKNITNVDNGIINLYGVWTIKGDVTITTKYSDGTSGAKATQAAVVLLRCLEGETEYEEIGKETIVNFDYDDSEEAGNGSYTFTDIPLADENGHKYLYRIEVNLNNYDTAYGDASSPNGIFDAALQFNPNNFRVRFEIDASDLKSANAPIPSKIYVKILFRVFDESKGMAHENHDVDGEYASGTAKIITQHEDYHITSVTETRGEDYLYTGEFDVWKENIEGANTIEYDYQIIATAYVMDNGDGTETVLQADDANYQLINFGDWVYYVQGSENDASDIMKAELRADYALEYETNGGINPADAQESYTFGEGISEGGLPKPERTGYTFDGWYSNEELDGAKVESISADASDTITLYAKWTPNTYDIAYDLNDEPDHSATNTDAPTGYVYGNGIMEADMPKPERDGYTFIGWYSEIEEDGSFDEDKKINSIATNQTGDITLYARWEIGEYRIEYQLNDDTTDPVSKASMENAPSTYTYGTGVTAAVLTEKATPVRPHYMFGGWYSENADTDGFDETKKVTDIGEDQFGDIALYAKWTADTYDITYELNDGIIADDAPKTYTYGDGIAKDDIPDPTKTGHEFGGWYSEAADADGKFDEQYRVDSIGSTDSGDITLHAKWTPSVYEIEYDLGEGVFKDGKPESYTYGEGVDSLPVPECDGYIFVGWVDEEGNTVTSISPDQIGDIKLTATWRDCTSEVTFNINKDDEVWINDAPVITLVDKDQQEITDLKEVLNGEYKIYADGEDTGETITVQYGSDNSKALNYYTLTVQADNGCEQPVGSGVYLVGSEIEIGVAESAGYYFSGWTSELVQYAPPTEQQQKISMPGYPVILTAHANIYTSEVIISVRLDGVTWPEKSGTVTLVQNEENGMTYDDLTNVPNGEYKIFVDGVDTKKTISVNHSMGRVPRGTVDYFTLTVVGESKDGIEEVFGSGIYLEGDTASVIADLKEGYSFEEWTSNVDGKAPTTKNASVEMNGPLKLVVKAKENDGTTYTVNHHVMNLTGDAYDKVSTEQLTGNKNENVTLTDLKNGALEVVGGIEYSHGTVDTNSVEQTTVLEDGSLVIDLYYDRKSNQLTLAADTGINSVSNGGTFYYGTPINITAGLEGDYVFTKWEADQERFGDVIHRETTIEMPAYDLQLTAEAKLKRSSVDIDLSKDNDQWKDAVITLQDKDGNILTDLTSVPDGEYKILVNGEESGATIEVEYGSGKPLGKQLEYYTLKLICGDGISKVTGEGLYLAGTSVSINAETVAGYVFTDWTGTETTMTSAAATLQMPKKELTLTANAKTATTNVTVTINKDGNTWGGETPDITLVDENGNVITDLTAVPDGTYKVYANGTDTGQTLTVKYGSVEVSQLNLEYFTLELKAGTGIESVDGSGVYLAGTEVKITAKLQEGYIFTGWSGHGDVITDIETTFTMPSANTTLTANAKTAETEPQDETEDDTEKESTKKKITTPTITRGPASVNTTSTRAAKTGDNTQTMILTVIMILAAGIIVYMSVRSKRTK